MNQPFEPFARSDRDEPHLRRRMEILAKYPGLKKLYGYDITTVYVTIAIVAAQFGIAYFLQTNRDTVFGELWMILLISYFIGSILSHWCAMSIHECSHNLAMRTADQNRWLAMFANLPLVFPSAMTFRRYHIEHHVLLGIDTEDTDLPRPFEVRFIGTSRFKKFFWLLFYLLVYVVRAMFFIKRPNRWELVNVAVQIPASIVVYLLLGDVAIMYLLLSTFFGHSLHPVAAHFIHEHYTFALGQETYSYYGLLNKVTFNVGYHYEHHDLMGIPGSRLPEVHRVAHEFYDGLVSHRSWTYVLWRFIWDRDLGPARRLVRDRATHNSSRREFMRAWRTQHPG